MFFKCLVVFARNTHTQEQGILINKPPKRSSLCVGGRRPCKMAGQRLGCFTEETQTSIPSGLSFRATFCGEGSLLLPDIYTPVRHTPRRRTHLSDAHTREAYTPEMHTPMRRTHLSANNLGEVWKWGSDSQTFTQVSLSVLTWSMPCGPGARAHAHYEAHYAHWLRLLRSLIPPIRDLSWD